VGLHTGVAGIGFATARVGELTGDPALVSQAVEHMTALSQAASEKPLLDFISGSSGAICVLLALHRTHHDDRLRDLADAFGTDIVRRGTVEDGIWTWSNAELSGATQWHQMLNGFAHGASGLAVALLELYAATGRDEFRQAALGAVAYEDQFVDAKEDNWKDLRIEGDGPAHSDGHTMAWCHGAPGIALARLRAMELLPDRAAEFLASVDIALRGTERHATKQLSAQAFDVTNCHGLAGLAEPFVVASRVLGETAFLQRGRRLWAEALRRREENAVWLSGVGSGGKNHSLMIGMAGAGYGLLRAYDPAQIRSVLLPE
jgi:lantibiotic modifying enzyme